MQKEENSGFAQKRINQSKENRPVFLAGLALIALLIIALVFVAPKIFSNTGGVEIISDVSYENNDNLIITEGSSVNSTPPDIYDNTGDENEDFTIFVNGGSANDSSYSSSSGSGSSQASSSANDSSYSSSSGSGSSQASSSGSSSQKQYFSGYTFRSSNLLTSHFQKHGSEVGASNETQYVQMANNVINTADRHKYEKEDGDDVYFKSSTGEIVFVSTDGYIRTYFIASQSYYDRQ